MTSPQLPTFHFLTSGHQLYYSSAPLPSSGFKVPFVPDPIDTESRLRILILSNQKNFLNEYLENFVRIPSQKILELVTKENQNNRELNAFFLSVLISLPEEKLEELFYDLSYSFPLLFGISTEERVRSIDKCVGERISQLKESSQKIHELRVDIVDELKVIEKKLIAVRDDIQFSKLHNFFKLLLKFSSMSKMAPIHRQTIDSLLNEVYLVFGLHIQAYKKEDFVTLSMQALLSSLTIHFRYNVSNEIKKAHINKNKLDRFIFEFNNAWLAQYATKEFNRRLSQHLTGMDLKELAPLMDRFRNFGKEIPQKVPLDIKDYLFSFPKQ